MACIEIKKDAVLHNLRRVQDLCGREGLTLTVVTKFCCSYPDVVKLLSGAGVRSIADSHMANFAALGSGADTPVSKSLIKTKLSDIRSIAALGAAARPGGVFVSDDTLVKAVAELPEKLRPEISLIIETGDYRDGFYPEDLKPLIAKYPGLPYAGVSANFACLSGKMPDAKSVRLLYECAEIVASSARAAPSNRAGGRVSIGGTVVYSFILSGALKKLFGTAGAETELRMGEGIFFGFDSSSGAALEGFRRDAFTLYGEIVEIREKLIKPVESPGHTALGGQAFPRKTGRRLCAVLDFGILGAAAKDLVPLDKKLECSGQTFDFTVADITESGEHYKTGGFIPFAAQYAAASQALLNPYVARRLI
jgi:predicted amino acid racemase